MKTTFKKGITGLEFLLIHTVVALFAISATEVVTDGGISKLSDTKKIEVVEQVDSTKK